MILSNDYPPLSIMYTYMVPHTQYTVESLYQIAVFMLYTSQQAFVCRTMSVPLIVVRPFFTASNLREIVYKGRHCT